MNDRIVVLEEHWMIMPNMNAQFERFYTNFNLFLYSLLRAIL